MSGRAIGIDLGTTNSVAAISDAEGVRVLADAYGRPLVPSVVSFPPDGPVQVGAEARERAKSDARNSVYSTKRLIGRPFDDEDVQTALRRFPFELRRGRGDRVLVAARDETFTLSEISAFILGEVRRLAEADVGEPCERAVVTVPANFDELQRAATKAAGRVAGFEILRILNEPTAAALAYGLGRGGSERIAIFDLGGGTFDVTLLELAGDIFEVLATAGDTYLGGDDVDALVVDRMVETFFAAHGVDPRDDPQAIERMRQGAEWAKKQLSERDEIGVRIDDLLGPSSRPRMLDFRITRPELERVAEPLLRRTFDVCEEALALARVRPSQLDRVILVGGSTRMPLVRRLVTEFFGMPPLTDIDPDLVVAQGAAVQAHALASAEDARGAVSVPRDRGDAYLPPTPNAFDRGERRALDEAPAAAPSVPGRRAAPEEVGVGRRVVPGGFEADVIELDEEASGLLVFSDLEPLAGRGDVFDAIRELDPEPSAELEELDPDELTPLDDEVPLDELGALHDAPPLEALDALDDAGPLPELPSPDARGLSSLPPPRLSSHPPEELGLDLPPLELAEVERPRARDDETEIIGAPAPILLDVTPHTLGIETVGGFREVVVERNAAIPVEQSRVFTTGRDDQRSVRLRVCQGESRRVDENLVLGEIVLEELPRGRRGEVKIDVSFFIDTDGTLAVGAVDRGTGRAQRVALALSGAVDDEEIDALRARHEAMRA